MSIIIPFDNKVNNQHDSIVVEHSDSKNDIAKKIANIFKDEVNFIADMSSFRQYKNYNELPQELTSTWMDKLISIKNSSLHDTKNEQVAFAYMSMMEKAAKRGLISPPGIDDAADLAMHHLYNSQNFMSTINNVIKGLKESRVCNGDIMTNINRELKCSIIKDMASFDKSTIESTVPTQWRDVVFETKNEKSITMESGLSI